MVGMASVCFSFPRRSFLQKCKLKLCPLLITNAQCESREFWSKQLLAVAFGLVVFCSFWAGNISRWSWVAKPSSNWYRDCTFASFNFRQIFDYLCHMQMCTTMLEIGFPFHLIRLVQDLHNNQQLEVLLLLGFRISKQLLVFNFGLSLGHVVNWLISGVARLDFTYICLVQLSIYFHLDR